MAVIYGNMLWPYLTAISVLIRVLCVLGRHQHSAYPVHVSLGNHLASARNKPEGKRNVGFIDIPPKRGRDPTEGYRYCARALYQRFWAVGLNHLVQWMSGLTLTLPGTSTPSKVHFRVGVIIADILEFRMLAAISASQAVRCHTRFEAFNSGAAVAEEEDGEEEDPELAPTGSDASEECSDLVEEVAQGDPPCDTAAIASRASELHEVRA